MIYKKGFVYHIKEDYFSKVNDDKLMKNKENGNFRPTYYCTKDDKTGLLWVVPMSSQYDKFKKIVERKIKKYKKCNTIILGNFDGRKSVFLLQNMFPITEKYLDHIHTRNNNPVPVNYKTAKLVEKSLKDLLSLTRKGSKIVFTDILRLERIMLQEIQNDKSEYKYIELNKEDLNKIDEKFNFSVAANPKGNSYIIKVQGSDYEQVNTALQKIRNKQNKNLKL